MNRISNGHTRRVSFLFLQIGIGMMLAISWEASSRAQSVEATVEEGALNPSAPARAYEVLYMFQGKADGGIPGGGVIQDAGGNLYGTTVTGGDLRCNVGSGPGCGVVFKLDKAGKETVLHSFTGKADGAQPEAGLTQDAAGNLYGTTFEGGASGNGTVFMLDADGELSTLHSFAGADGSGPNDLVRDANGNFYGATGGGGASGNGTLFTLDTDGELSTLYSFTGGSDGSDPHGVVRDAAGNLYGTALHGGDPSCSCGTVFKLDTAGKLAVLHVFTGGKEGAFPVGSQARDAAGNLYGASYGGVSNEGTVFKVDAHGKFITLHTFLGTPQGSNPEAGVIRDAAANLYGTTTFGGGNPSCFCGTVFRLDKTGNETVLHSFAGGSDGVSPQGGLFWDAAEALYGTTILGGAADEGVVFKLTP